MKHAFCHAAIELGLIPATGSDFMNIREARELLNMNQREAATNATAAHVAITQAAICRMETGRLPIAIDYATWLAAQVIQRKQYKRVQDMPVGVLVSCIRNRSEI